MPRATLLNPCDYLFYAHHLLTRDRDSGDNTVVMTLDAEGHADPAEVRRALARALVRHPVAMSRLRISTFFAWPVWKGPSAPAEAADEAAERAYVFDDLRSAPDASAVVDRLCEDRCTMRWPLGRGPQVRLEQYALPGDRTRFCLRWPHMFMDAEGGMWLLSEISRAGRGAWPPELTPDDRPLDVLAGRRFLERLRLVRRGFAVQRQHRRRRIRPLVVRRRGGPTRYRLLHRCWRGPQVERMEAQARQWTPPGPALYARYLAACVLRSVHRIYVERGLATDGYVVPLPMSVLRPASTDRAGPRRSIQGNYLVSLLLFATPEEASDRRRLGEAIREQFLTYQRDRVDHVQWAMVWAASFMRTPMYEWVLRLPLGFESMVSGFSYLGEMARPISEFVGLRVTNLWATGPIATPPGWNPVFSRFQDTLNLAMLYTHPAIDDELAQQLVTLIGDEVLNEG